LSYVCFRNAGIAAELIEIPALSNGGRPLRVRGDYILALPEFFPEEN
jgi:hypothetical protein